MGAKRPRHPARRRVHAGVMPSANRTIREVSVSSIDGGSHDSVGTVKDMDKLRHGAMKPLSLLVDDTSSQGTVEPYTKSSNDESRCLRTIWSSRSS